MEDYKIQFTKLSRRAPGFSPELLLACFIKGLKDDIRIDVKAQKPWTLYEACELAKMYEEKYERHKSNARMQISSRVFSSSTGPTRISSSSFSPRPFTHPAWNFNHVPLATRNPNSHTVSPRHSQGNSITSGNKNLSQLEYQVER